MPHTDECKNAIRHYGYGSSYCIGGCAMIFEVTEDHLKLAQRMYWDWDDGGYDGAPAVGLKRPYGNSDVLFDIIEILGWNEGWTDEQADAFYEEDNDEIRDRAMRIHREMETVLQIATCTLSWEPGEYYQMRQYDARSWKKVEPNE